MFPVSLEALCFEGFPEENIVYLMLLGKLDSESLRSNHGQLFAETDGYIEAPCLFCVQSLLSNFLTIYCAIASLDVSSPSAKQHSNNNKLVVI